MIFSMLPDCSDNEKHVFAVILRQHMMLQQERAVSLVSILAGLLTFGFW